MLTIKDLAVAKELDSKAMNSVAGGLTPLLGINTSTRSDNKVIDMDQMFKFDFAQLNVGDITNNQALKAGNGTIEADADQRMAQNNAMHIRDVGNAYIS